MKKYKRGTSLFEYCVRENKTWLLEQFDFDKNWPKTPADYTKSSDNRIWFKYECGHSCLQRIADKTGKNSMGCPTCLNRGKIGRSLLEEYPYYAEMFLVEKNGVTPNDVSKMNGKIFWWKCQRCGNEFRGKVSDVVQGHRVCNECSNTRRSFPEYCLGYYLLQIDKDREINKSIEGYKFDLFLPKYNLVIEYDGYPWHNSKMSRKNDAIKDKICKGQGHALLRIRDTRLDENEELSSDIWKFEYDGRLSFLSELPARLRQYIGSAASALDVDISRDFKEIQAFQHKLDKSESLLAHMPQLNDFIDFDDKRNGNPEYVCTSSNKIRFWLRHPKYPTLKWSLTAHNLFHKQDPYTQWIRMCIKLIDKYPELENQVLMVGNEIRETSVFQLKCACGNMFKKSYAALMGKTRVCMCSECLKAYRLKNLGIVTDA